MDPHRWASENPPAGLSSLLMCALLFRGAVPLDSRETHTVEITIAVARILRPQLNFNCGGQSETFRIMYAAGMRKTYFSVNHNRNPIEGNNLAYVLVI